jgi:3-deoxy-7-phosphoheptulonate synthase / chorismate mutase
MDDPVVDELRARITAVDRDIFRLVNERLRLVAQLRRHKDEHGYAFVDPERERRMVDDQLAANDGPISDDGLRGLYAELLALTKRETS